MWIPLKQTGADHEAGEGEYPTTRVVTVALLSRTNGIKNFPSPPWFTYTPVHLTASWLKHMQQIKTTPWSS